MTDQPDPASCASERRPSDAFEIHRALLGWALHTLGMPCIRFTGERSP